MGAALKKLTINGFKSIENLDGFELQELNVLIGANGAGKSNFVDFFRLLKAIADEGLQKWTILQGGGDGLFYLGPQHTRSIRGHVTFGQNEYQFKLEPAAHGGVMLGEEATLYSGGKGLGSWNMITRGAPESSLKGMKDQPARWIGAHGPEYYVYDSIASWTIYHFHDTSMLAPMRRDQTVRDRDRFRPDASNIAAFLLHLREKHESCYQLIRDTIRLIAPFFDDFLLRPEERGGNEQVRLEWHQKGSDFPFQPNQLSDGTIRFICLATALLQPKPPATIVIDEPELGLHPIAISTLADLIKSASARTQVIISTQSPILLDYFEPKQVVVVNRVEGRSTFERLDPKDLKQWIDEYSVGELWQKNVVRGGPTHE